MAVKRFKTCQKQRNCSSNDIDVVILPSAPDQLTDEKDVDDNNLDSTELHTDIPGTLEIFRVSEPHDHIVFFDNHFRGLPILDALKRQGFIATGTLRQNFTQKFPLMSVKVMEKKKRASHDSYFNAAYEFLLVRWNE
ncbi:hypothetical protein ILUMI_24063 [Ignelater luminosus]|uniref:PiggyBac transposable element-derived protein domain-containing protein n=1 Tax=Ignelater luminosus TaxID=2038154 RepID=A0A8K0C6Y2_IGNLU|nr:hypothetical protein ILUMI_24063 [Ignelater luminosus]